MSGLTIRPLQLRTLRHTTAKNFLSRRTIQQRQKGVYCQGEYTEEQLAFLERKRQSKETGQVVLPQERLCMHCSGEGQRECHQCEGKGVNGGEINKDKAQYASNGLVDPTVFFVKGGPCWLCRGIKLISCKECQGTGIANIDDLVGE
eukprot:TRINITY_DN1522_c0_g1_i4.p2 TRINITY_DN1522_c0_g1~~TRINITY_DN1522_c0_g1_i4.p2  ORF type:complete len:147 (-),score=10.54 TRINITY_DN1522_c0_g1_i4:219-659(-)